MTKQKIKIDIVSDINCPWCYLGKERLNKAMKETNDKYDFELSFRPFELNPNAPQEGEEKDTYFIRNYGPEALGRIQQSSVMLTEMGKKEGAEFNFEKSTVIHNTFNGHRLIWLAGKYGVQERIASELFKANFTEGLNINDPEILRSIGIANGIPAEKLNGFFESEEGKDEVKELERQAQVEGISGVPNFIFNDKFSVSGAQSAGVFKNVFDQVAASNS